jgi:hypothetical protein
MTRSTLLLLLALSLAACNPPSGPKQTLVFKATSTANAADLERSQQVITGRLRSAELKCRFQVKPAPPSRLEVITFVADEADLEKIKASVTANVQLEFAPIASALRDAELLAAAKDAEGEVKIGEVVRGAWLPLAKPDSSDAAYLKQVVNPEVIRERDVDGRTRLELLVAYDPECRVTGEHLSSATASIDQAGAPALAFVVRADEVWRMSSMTAQLRPAGNLTRQLAIIWNGAILSAPTVQSQINAHGQITGNFTQGEVKEMAALLVPGQLPCTFEFEKSTAEGK